MTKFESLLTAYLLGLSASCVGGKVTASDSSSDTSSVAVGATCDSAPDDNDNATGSVVRSEGFVAVAPGSDCPAAEDVTELDSEICCPLHTFAGTVCAETGRRDNQVAGDYGYYSAATSTTTTGAVDLCLYDGLFEVTGTCCGRPLLQGGEPVVAALARTDRWSDRAAPRTDGLSGEQRRALGERWLRAALLEHASVASFARFTLDLLRWGAPPELVGSAQQAAHDEVEHARLCFAIASGYLGQPAGPSEMALGETVALSPTFEAFVETLVREGCVGETMSVFEAAEQLQSEEDPAVRAALGRIVADESRHASLAWSTLRWALERQPSLAARADRLFAEQRERRPARDPGWDEVIAPALAALAS